MIIVFRISAWIAIVKQFKKSAVLKSQIGVIRYCRQGSPKPPSGFDFFSWAEILNAINNIMREIKALFIG